MERRFIVERAAENPEHSNDSWHVAFANAQDYAQGQFGIEPWEGRSLASTMTSALIRKRLAFSGALLFFVGMLTGLWAAATLTDTVVVGIPRLALIAHLNALLGGLWLLAVAWSFEFLYYTERGLRRLAIGVAIPAWSNWLVTLFASFLGVTGLTYTGNRANNVIAFLLQALVVLPTLIASAFWVWGFRERR
jgi:(hydroxyamino)benzene mutase